MLQIREIKRTLTAMQEVKTFDDAAYFAILEDPRDCTSNIQIRFLQGDVLVTLEAPVIHEAEEEAKNE